MNLYLTLKLIHILSSVVLVGTGFGSAYYMFYANRSENIHTQSYITQWVVRADWWFTTPTIFIQPATGIAMAHIAGLPLSTPWLQLSIALFFLAGACWLPVVWLQIRMAKLAKASSLFNQPLPATYGRYAKAWEYLGYPAFIAMLCVFYLMVVKPEF